jgi:hypothetical protein
MDSDKTITANFEEEQEPPQPDENRCIFNDIFGGGGGQQRVLTSLRDVRDTYLMPSSYGRIFVFLYYQLSPILINVIDDHSSLRPLAFQSLLPVVAISFLMASLKPLVVPLFLFSLIVIPLIGMVVIRKFL